ncbi:MAG: endonuclease/exonuclease/phosphatase family protein [Candidatus Thiodiazotropha endolucinida]|nr:endonuclease/exonuclease/phosphatase family protein [Candidatus Thiodiazotropha endolucinida]MCW4344963.1 endonuclease/exonuclease/phosphatase family protein [Candidatus Thiodiazotropha endolucinida]
MIDDKSDLEGTVMTSLIHITSIKIHSTAVWAALLGLLLITSACSTPNYRMSVVTWNVQYRTLPVSSSPCCDLVPNRAEQIANKILTQDIDVLAINEAFDDAIEDVLVDKLPAGGFGHFVKVIEGESGGKFEVSSTSEVSDIISGRLVIGVSAIAPFECALVDACQDSGLMVFSKYPFRNLPAPRATVVPSDQLTATSGTSSWLDVGFRQYLLCEGVFRGCSDCAANKGVGLVRIEHPAGITYSVAFTHAEACSVDRGVAPLIRDVGFDVQPDRTAERLFKDTHGGIPADEPLLLMGDFNVDGNIRKMRSEWQSKFNTTGRFFTDEFEDGWDAQFPASLAPAERDPGFTAGLTSSGGPDDYSRLDYVLWNDPVMSQFNDGMCVQHVRVLTDMVRSRFGHDLSDHYPVQFTLNAPYDYCGPREARLVQVTDFVDPDHTARFIGSNIRINYKRGAQWYLVKEPGTYTISARVSSGTTPRVEVYSTLNLSTPLRPQRGASGTFGDTQQGTFTGPTYASPSEPFFIKVSHIDNTIGAYELLVHRHRGFSIDDSIVLYPNSLTTADYPLPTVGSGLGLWYRIDTDGPFSGAAQSMTFRANAATNRFSVALFNTDASVRQPASLGELLRSDVSDNNATFFLNIVPLTAFSLAFPYTVQWQTNLNVLLVRQDSDTLYPGRIIARQQTDQPDIFGEDDDDVRIQFHADGLPVYTVDREDVEIRLVRAPNLGDFDSESVRNIDSRVGCSIGFLDTLTVDLIEDDSEFRGPDDHILGFMGFDRGMTIERLALDETERVQSVWPMSGDGGLYRFMYNMAHGTHQQFSGTNKRTVTASNRNTSLPPLTCAR